MAIVRGVSAIGALRSRSRNKNAGGTAIVIALSLPMLVGTLGAAGEATAWYEMKRKVQSAADAAALAGAYKHAAGDDATADGPAGATRRARERAGITVTIDHPPTSGAHAGRIDAIEARAEGVFTPMLSRLFVANGITIDGRALVRINRHGADCVFTLHDSSSGAIASTIHRAGCNAAPANPAMSGPQQRG